MPSRLFVVMGGSSGETARRMWYNPCEDGYRSEAN
jgi:hypothetical protein